MWDLNKNGAPREGTEAKWFYLNYVGFKRECFVPPGARDKRFYLNYVGFKLFRGHSGNYWNRLSFI